MKKLFSVVPKKFGDVGSHANHSSHALNDRQPNLLILARKLFGTVSSKSSYKKDMYMSIESDWPQRQRHPAGGNHPQEHVGKVRAERIIIEGDLLCYSEEEEEEKVGVYIGEAPVSRLHNYFEVEILQMGAGGAISVGLCPQWYPLHKLPGWIRESIGYHADDGKLYKGKSFGVVFGPKCGPGDRMGCGVKYELISPSKAHDILPVFFTKNGREVGSVRVSVPDGGLFPCVGLVGSGDAVRLIPHHLWPPEEDVHMVVDSNEDEWNKLYHLRHNGEYLEYSGRGASELDVGLAQASHPLNTSSHFFQLEIVDPGKDCFITIGLTGRNYPKHRHPGWNSGSIAYHGDDGHLFAGHSVGVPFGPPCDKGDVMGCGIIFPREFFSSCQKCGGDCPTEDYCEDLDEEGGLEGEGERVLEQMEGNDLLSCVLQYSDPSNGGEVHDQSNDHGADQRHSQCLTLLSDSDEEDMEGPPREALMGNEDVNPAPNEEFSAPVVNKNKVQVFFTHNGKMVGRREASIPRGGFYPCVSMGSLHECVKVDLHPMTG